MKHSKKKKGKRDKKRRHRESRSRRHKEKKHSKHKGRSCCKKKSLKKTPKTSSMSDSKTITPVIKRIQPVLPEPPKLLEPPKPIELPPQPAPVEQIKATTPPQPVVESAPQAETAPPAPPATTSAVEELKPEKGGIAHKVAGQEPTQELCISQYVKGGNEYSRWTYITMFPVGEKPEYIYLPRIRPKTGSSADPVAKTASEKEAKEQASSNNLSPHVINQLSKCESALEKARGNLDSLKIMARKDDRSLTEMLSNDAETLLEEINSLTETIRKTKDKAGVNVDVKTTVKRHSP